MLYSHKVISNKKKCRKEDFDFLDKLKEIECFDISKTTIHLDCLHSRPLQQWMNFSNFIVLGTGGSSLGAQAIHSISSRSCKNIKFVNNLDPTTLKHIFSEIDLNNTGFLCISKSGETLETICQTLIAIELTASLKEFRKHFVVITENKNSSLKGIANQFNFLSIDHPSSIGGRFSVFSIVGMLPALLCGIDPQKILRGANRVLTNYENSISKIKDGAEFVVNNLMHNIDQQISFIYSDKLTLFGKWLEQLYAESSGKNGKGLTTISAIGAIDQHSQLQLYLDGPQNKFFTFFREKSSCDLKIPNENLPIKFFYLKNKNISDIFHAQCEGTMSAIIQKNADVRLFDLSEITPEILGALFMHFMLEVACVCTIMRVDPFDQPAVENGKIVTKSILCKK